MCCGDLRRGASLCVGEARRSGALQQRRDTWKGSGKRWQEGKVGCRIWILTLSVVHTVRAA